MVAKKKERNMLKQRHNDLLILLVSNYFKMDAREQIVALVDLYVYAKRSV